MKKRSEAKNSRLCKMYRDVDGLAEITLKLGGGILILLCFIVLRFRLSSKTTSLHEYCAQIIDVCSKTAGRNCMESC